VKLTIGVKWGLVAGLVVGVLAGVLAYMSVMSILDALVEYVYQSMVKTGSPQDQARQVAELTRQITPPSAFAGSIVGNVIVYLIMGLIMAAVWERLRLPWYAKGALFGVVLTALLNLPSLLSPPPPDLPTPPAVYGYASTALSFAGPILLAWLLNRAASRP
jgi:phosphotransferase system  glucose/maltose/N-acetylglucosamine-specific IIC component